MCLCFLRLWPAKCPRSTEDRQLLMNSITLSLSRSVCEKYQVLPLCCLDLSFLFILVFFVFFLLLGTPFWTCWWLLHLIQSHRSNGQEDSRSHLTTPSSEKLSGAWLTFPLGEGSWVFPSSPGLPQEIPSLHSSWPMALNSMPVMPVPVCAYPTPSLL